MRGRVARWTVPALWLALPAAIGPGLAEALDDRSTAVAATAATWAWAGWSIGLLALLIPRASGLTCVRIVALGAVAVGGHVAVDEAPSTGLRVLALGTALVAALAVLAPATGERLADGSSYGDEHRVLLRTPFALLLGPVPVAALVVLSPIAGTLLLAAEQWLAGALTLVVSVPIAVLAARRLDVLAHRWLVFVPAGVVVHDPLTLADPVLLPRRSMRRIGPAPLVNLALDLTREATGLAIEIELVEPVVVAPIRPGEDLTPVGVTSVLVTPTRPGHVLGIAESRRLPLG